MKKKFYLLVSLLVLLGVLLSACGGETAAPTEEPAPVEPTEAPTEVPEPEPTEEPEAPAEPEEPEVVEPETLDPAFLDAGYSRDLYPEKDFHTLYFGEILECYEI